MNAEELRSICLSHGITVSLTDLVREADAAFLIGIHVQTLRELVRADIAPLWVLVGRQRRYPLDGLAAYLTPKRESEEECAKVSRQPTRTAR